MQLDSYLEIFTTLYGWAFANIIGEILVGTGLVVLPFALIVFSAWRDVKESGGNASGVLGFVDAVTFKLVAAMFVMSVCFATTPVTSLNNVNLSYTPTSTSDGSAPVPGSSQGGTGSGFDSAMGDAKSGSFSTAGSLAYVPAWWFTTMAISSGINNAIRSGIANAGPDIRMIEDMARNATIEDPVLLKDVQRFYSECFIPARSKYLAMARSDISAAGQAILSPDNKEYGPTDVDWIGSQLFRTEPGFYDTMRSYNPVANFPIDFARDTDYIQTPAEDGTPEAGYTNPQWGRPTCDQWWETADIGLRDRLTQSTSNWQNLLQRASNVLTWTSADAAKDSVAHLAQTKANPNFVDADRIMGNDYDVSTRVGRSAAGWVSMLGLFWKAGEASMTMTPLMFGLPMMQALVLMALYMFLPVITFLSGFNLKVMFLGAIAIFTVKFWAVMWYIAEWVDAHLINAMYPGAQGSVIMQQFTQMGDSPTYKRTLLNILLMAMFVGLPVIWSSMMAWIGVYVGKGLSEMASATGKDAQGIASKSGSIAGSIAGSVAKKGR
jgi:hypothetical protein